MKIAYLCDRDTYLHKMSRVRFHGIQAISETNEVKWLGRGWGNDSQLGFVWNGSLTVDENFKRLGFYPDLIIGYKPLDILGFCDSKFKKCIRYNEMYDVEWTIREIVESNADIVVCHHQNDYEEYVSNYQVSEDHKVGLSSVTFVNIPHCAEKTVFKDYGLAKEIDLLLVGATFAQSTLGQHYPLRDRMASDILPKLSLKYNCKIYEHPGYNMGDSHTNIYAQNFARAINSAKIAITCSGLPRSRFGKYVEIPMCRTAIAADMPGEMQDFFKEFLINIDMSHSDEQIIALLESNLKEPHRIQQKADLGYEMSKKFDQEYYAESFNEKVLSLL